jgi:hypothetical protein
LSCPGDLKDCTQYGITRMPEMVPVS